VDWTKIVSIEDVVKLAVMTTPSQQFYKADEPTKSHDGVQQIDTTEFSKANSNLSGIERQEDQQDLPSWTV